MSKKKVEEAIDLVGLGDPEGAMATLKNVPNEYLEKRLRHLLGVSTPRRSQVIAELWRRLLPTRALPDGVSTSCGEAAVEDCGLAEKPEGHDAERHPALGIPSHITLEQPAEFLRWLDALGSRAISFTTARLCHVWSLVALGVLARPQRAGSVRLLIDSSNAASRFAQAVGLMNLASGRENESPGEAGRTFKLRGISSFLEIEPAASEISRLLLPDVESEDTRRALAYVIVELLRNAVQHSQDPLGGVVAAQRTRGPDPENREFVQVAVGDAGVGIPAALQGLHPELADPRAAVAKAIEPHISGTFEEGLTGSQQNAGMGLFFISEMAKLTAGHLLIATRGATLVLRGDIHGAGRHRIELLDPPGLGFPGTLVAFELPLGEVSDYDALIRRINDTARLRTPQRAVQQWLAFDEPAPESATRIIVRLASENTVEAGRVATSVLQPRILERMPVLLDFEGVSVCTQSFVHALLYETLRMAWALRTRIYVAHATAAVRSSLELLQSYALGG